MPGADLLGHKAGQNVDLVAGSGRNEKVCAVFKRLRLHIVAAAVARNAAHIINVDDGVHDLLMGVDHDNIVPVPRQLPGERLAHLAQTYDDDFHARAFLILPHTRQSLR